jgi:hypothetical protein
MTDRAAEIAYFSTQIRKEHEVDLRQKMSIPSGAIADILKKDPFRLPADDLEAIRRQLEFMFSVRQEAGSSIKSDYAPWLGDRKKRIDFYYWTRLRQYYLGDDVLPPNVVSQLDNVTDEVLDYCGNPDDEGLWSRRGMVMGHVQSGKTTNYASLISKAADSGYKIIILLAGLTNSLRQQTQERMDEAFIGKRSMFNDTRVELMPIMTYCSGKRTHPAYGTTRDQDFSKAVSQFGVTLANLKDPIIFVVKKNKSILSNLLEWIISQSNGQRIHYPLMLVDDEADNASVNTHKDPKKSTAINEYIRQILQQFSRSSYVGYTATPFANIFIDPNTEDEMRGDDLFPRHFIKTLDAPSNYVGATRVFPQQGDLRKQMLRIVKDYDVSLPLAHKRDHQLQELPSSLKEAIRAFLIVRAVRVLRGDGKKHASMMVNVSRFNDVQERVHGLVYSYQKALDDSVRTNSALGEQGLSDPLMSDLKKTYEKEFSEVEFSFSEIMMNLLEASRSIVVRTVNMRGGELDYEKNRRSGLHVVAVGGLALARGLTLEGLAITYILRNAEASDTLMQMARWFGYRRNYEDICRLYICKQAVEHYEYIADAVEELRGELKRMELRGETPEQFGLKVRRSETGIRITAANKMRSAKSIQFAQSYESRHVEGYALENSGDTNRENFKVVFDFLATLGASHKPLESDEPPVVKEMTKHLVWRGVSGDAVYGLLTAFKFHADQPALGWIDGRRSLFSDYCSDRLRSELSLWDVVVPLNNGRRADSFDAKYLGDSQELPIRARNSGRVKKSSGIMVFKPTGDRNRVADPNEDAPLLLPRTLRERADEIRKEGEFRGDRAFCNVRTRPLLLVHVFNSDVEDETFALKGTPIVSLSFCMPPTNQGVQARTYQVNAVYRKQMEALFTEDDDDEALFDREPSNA